jgi:hypothetical protein
MPRERRVPDALDDDVVAGGVGAIVDRREVLVRVVDDPVGAVRADELGVPCARHGGHARAAARGELHRRDAHGTRGAVDEHLGARSELDPREVPHRGVAPEDDRGRLLERQPRGLGRDVAVLRDHGVLGVAAHPAAEHRDHLVAGSEPGDAGTHRLDDARRVHAEHVHARTEQADRGRDEEREPGRDVAAPQPVIGDADRGRVHSHQHLPRAGHRARQIGDAHDLRRAEPVEHRGPHRVAARDPGCSRHVLRIGHDPLPYVVSLTL